MNPSTSLLSLHSLARAAHRLGEWLASWGHLRSKPPSLQRARASAETSTEPTGDVTKPVLIPEGNCETPDDCKPTVTSG